MKCIMTQMALYLIMKFIIILDNSIRMYLIKYKNNKSFEIQVLE